MTTRSDQELLQAWMDGALSEGESAALRERLARDAGLRARADELKRLSGLMTALEPSDPPETFADEIMTAVSATRIEPVPWWRRARATFDQLFGWFPGHLKQDARRQAAVRWNAGSSGGGEIVAKKALWAVAGIAVVIVLVVVYFNGTRTVDQDAQGTIGGADRYRGAQPANVAVKEGDVQKFLQSDTFDRILKDDHVRSLLSNREACALMGSPEFAALMAKAELMAALQREDVAAVLKQNSLLSALSSPAVAAVMSKAELMAALQNGEIDAALRSQNVANLLADAEVQASLVQQRQALAAYAEAALKGEKALKDANAELNASLKNNAKLMKLMSDPAFDAALKQGGAAALFADADFQAAMKGEGRALFGNPDFDAALKNGRALFADANFHAALAKNQALFANAELFAALQNAEFAQLLARDANLHAALQNAELMGRALNSRR